MTTSTAASLRDHIHEKPERPLQGILVLDFSQFLSGSLATLRLADMGARVIKIERPGTGDLGRSLYLSDTDVHGENTLFHAINRNKESYAADLKNPSDLDKLRAVNCAGRCHGAELSSGSHGAAGLRLRQGIRRSTVVWCTESCRDMEMLKHGVIDRDRICWRRRAPESCG